MPRTREKTKIDKLIEPAIQKVAKRTADTYFWKSSVVNEVLKNRQLAGIVTDLRTRYGAWKLDQLMMRYIDSHVGHVLQQRDANGIRVYECYAVGKPERRWQPLRAMTANGLRSVMQQTRVQARQLTLKGEGYHIFLEELEKLGQPDARVDEIYEKAAPRIRALRQPG